MIPAYVWASVIEDEGTNNQKTGPLIPAQPETPVVVTRRAPTGRVTPALKFSVQPTDAELFAAPIFSQALVPVGKSTTEENQALVNALSAYAKRGEVEDQSILLKFLEKHPGSVWKPALLLNLGIAWRQSGHFTRAISAWEAAWQLTKTQTDFKTKAMADCVLGELAQIYNWTGGYEKLEPLLKEIKTRELGGNATELVAVARAGLEATRHKTADFNCGPYALKQLMTQNQKEDAGIGRLFQSRIAHQGDSLTELRKLALQLGMKYQMARRKSGAAIPSDSVIHWKLNHYSAVLKKNQDRYTILDPVFNRVYGHNLSVSQATLDEESDGYFLIPDGPLPAGWEKVSDEDGQTVFGRGSSPNGPDPNAYTKKDLKDCQGKTIQRMAFSGAHLHLVNLTIVDFPVGYTPPRGPAVEFEITYNQKDNRNVANPNYPNFGSKWTYDWFSYITDAGIAGDRGTVTRYARGGGHITHAGYAGGVYPLDRDGMKLTYNTATDSYELTAPDGSKEVFGQPSTTVPGERKIFLTKIIDPFGNALTISYDNSLRISHINDALNQTTTFHYDLASDPYKVTSIEDPFQRVARFEYDANNRLSKITDVIGITSAFAYSGAGDFINQMTTPYGTTTFDYYQGDAADLALLITDPNGDRECIRYKDTAAIPSNETVEPVFPGNVQPVSGIYQYRNTFYFDKKAMSYVTAGNTASSILASLDSNLDKATTYHWLHNSELPGSSSGIPETIKRPLEGRVWFLYPGQTSATASGGITLSSPSIVARVVEDPAFPDDTTKHVDQIYQFSYNNLGRLTKFTDPIGRQTTVDYYANGLDVWKIRQTSPGINDLLAEFGPYSVPHRPSTYIDASRQTYSLEWNNDGQLAVISNPLQEKARLHYDASGYLKYIDQLWNGPTKRTSLGYDGYGRLNAVTNSENYFLTCQYDALDRPIRLNFPDQTFEQYDYSKLDLVRVWDRTGLRTQVTYDNARRPLTVKDRLNRVTSFSWCGCGGLESMTDPMQRTTRWLRDLQGRVTDKVYHDSPFPPFGRHHHYDYYSYVDANGQTVGSGRFKAVTDSSYQSTTYAYFADNTLKKISHTLSGNPIASTPDVSLTYSSQYRRLATMTDGIGLTTFGYNPVTAAGTLGAGRLASIDGPLDNSITTYRYNAAYGYDELGRVNSRTINGIGESALFDSLGRVASHTTPLGTFYPGFANASRKLTSLLYPNGQTTSVAYKDNLEDQRLSEIWNKTSSGATLSYFAYQYDDQGQIKEWFQQMGASTLQTEHLEYDAEGQLLNANIIPRGEETGTKAYTYRYDAMGNRLSEQVDDVSANTTTVTASSYNDLNQLTARTGSGALPVRFKGTVNEPATVTVDGQAATVVADSTSPAGGRTFTAKVDLTAGSKSVTVAAKDYGQGAGNTATRYYNLTVAGGVAKTFSTYDNNGNPTGYTSPAGNVTYEWDAENRLIAVVKGTTSRTEFSYDGFGRRVKIVERSPGLATSPIISTRRYIWIGKSLKEERDVNNTVTRRFYSGGEQINGVNYYYTRDHLGSIREMTDSAGVVRARYDYDPFGRRSANQIQSGAVEASFGFTGHYYHAPSGLYLALYRAYDSDLGRWLNRDPIGEFGGLNLYGYVGNNPIFWIDPYGLFKWGQFLKGAAATIGGVLGMAGGAALSEAGIGVPIALSGAIGFQYGLGNMVAAFSDNEEAAKTMEQFPSGLGELAGGAVGSVLDCENGYAKGKAAGGFVDAWLNAGKAGADLAKSGKLEDLLEGAKSVVEGTDSVNDFGKSFYNEDEAPPSFVDEFAEWLWGL